MNIKQGDLFKLGKHILMCGDATNKENIQNLIKADKIDLIFTDPPYGMNKKIKNDNLKDDEFLQFNKDWILNSLNYLKEYGSFYIWGKDESIMSIYADILRVLINDKKIALRNVITWDKGSAIGQKSPRNKSYAKADEKCLFLTKNADEYLGYKAYKESFGKNYFDNLHDNMNSVWHFNRIVGGSKERMEAHNHPTIKPVKLCVRGIKTSSKEGDIVLDLFGGSGSVLIACEETKRQARIMELDEKWVVNIITRWEKHTGLKATRIN